MSDNDRTIGDFVSAIWSVAKVIGVLLAIVILFYACSSFVDEQGSTAWFYKAGPAR